MEHLPHTPSHADWVLALAWCRSADRERLKPLVALDLALADMWQRRRDANLFLIRMAWWRTQLEGPGERAADPVLVGLVGNPALVNGALQIVDGWSEMAELESDQEALRRQGQLRARGFAHALELGAADEQALAWWALRDQARRAGGVPPDGLALNTSVSKAFIRVLLALVQTEAGPFSRIIRAAASALRF